MASVTAKTESIQHVLGLIRSLKVSVEDLIQVTAERLEETQNHEPRTLAAFLDMRAASKEHQIAFAIGEALSTDTVSTLLQISNAAVYKAKDEGRILAYRVPGKRYYLFPAFQFEGGAVARWIPELIQIVGNGFSALHFLTVKRKSLNNQSFLTRVYSTQKLGTHDAVVASVLKKARSLSP